MTQELIGSTSQHDYILLDGSGSMRGKWWPSLAAIDTYIDTLKIARVNTHILLSVFSCDFGTSKNFLLNEERNLPIHDWTPLSTTGIGAPFGGTPLYDAINAMGRRLRDIDPPRAAATIVTDGEECDSKTSLDDAKRILDWMRAKGWQVTFIGCDFDNRKTAALLGGNPASAIGVQQSLLSDAAKSLAAKRARYALYGEQMHFTKGEQTQFGGYLTAAPADEPANG
jgi:hypothetical protein